MLKKSLFILFLFLGTSACQTNGQNPAADHSNLSIGSSQDKRSTPHLMKRNPDTIATEKEHNLSGNIANTPRKTDLMRAMGLEVQEGKIILDTKQSKRFFKALGRELEKSMKQSMAGVQNRCTKATEIGIRLDKEKIVIDLNRTKNFMEKWEKTLKILGDELEESFAPDNP